MPKLLSSMHPLSQLPLLSVLVLTLRRSLPNFPSIPPPPLSRALSPRALCLWTPSSSPSRPSVSRLSSCDTPNLYALILVHTDSGYLPGKGYILLATFTLHNARQSLFPPVPGSVHTRSFFFFATAFLLSFFSFWNIHVRLRGDFSTMLFPKIALGSFFTQELFFPLKKKRKKENFNSNNIQYEERVSIGIMKNSSIGTISPFIRSCSRIDRR